MNKLFNKIATITLGLAMAIGVGVAIGGKGSGVRSVNAADKEASASVNSSGGTSSWTLINGSDSIVDVSASAVTTYASQLRMAANSTLTFAPHSGQTITMKAIRFKTNSSTNYMPGNGSTYSIDGGSATGFTANSSTNATLTPTSSASSSIVIKFGNDIRLTELGVTYAVGESSDITDYTKITAGTYKIVYRLNNSSTDYFMTTTLDGSSRFTSSTTEADAGIFTFEAAGTYQWYVSCNLSGTKTYFKPGTSNGVTIKSESSTDMEMTAQAGSNGNIRLGTGSNYLQRNNAADTNIIGRYTGTQRDIFKLIKTISNHTVSFNMHDHGTQVESETVTHGGKATQPTAPTETGWEFGGWYKEAACTNAWVFNTDTVTADTTLHAKWTATTYNISYSLDGGTHGSTHPGSGTYDTAFYVSAPTKTGYTFTGWTVTSGLNSTTAKWGTTSSPSTAISSSSTKCVNGASGNVYFKNINPTKTAVTLTATWTINTYTVNGGDATANISDGHLSSASPVNYNNPLSISIVPDTDFTYPASMESVTMGGVDYDGYTYDKTDGSFYIEHVTGDVVITAKCIDTRATERTFSYSLTRCSISNAPASMYDNETKELQIVPDEHYKLPLSSQNKVSVSGIQASEWSYSDSTGKITITNPSGNMTVSVECVAKAQNTITVDPLTGVTQQSGDPTSVEEGATVTLTFVAAEGYGLPTSSGISVTGTGSSFTWTQGTGKLQITGGTGNITVSVTGIQRDLTDGDLTIGSKQTEYTLGETFVKPTTVTAHFNLAPTTVDVKNDVVVSGSAVTNGVVSGSGTVTLTYTFETTHSTQSVSYDITATPITPSAGGYTLVTSSKADWSGTYVIASDNYLMGNTVSSGRVANGGAAPTVVEGKITSDVTNAMKWTIASTTGGYTIKNVGNNKYLSSTGGKNAGNMVDDVASDGKTTWTISYSSNTFTIVNKYNSEHSVNATLVNNGTYGWATYQSNSSGDPAHLYEYNAPVVAELKWITAVLKSGTYYKGTDVTASNFTVTGHYNDGTTSPISSGITVTNGHLNETGPNEVTLTYSGLSCTVTVNATQAPVSELSIDPSSASIGLNENYDLSNVTVTVTPSYAITTYTWEIIDDGDLVEGTDYTFANDVYHSINPGTVTFRCKSTEDASKFADFTLFISAAPEISITESSFTGYAGKGAVLHFTYLNITDENLDKIHFSSSATNVVDFADGPDAGSGSGTIELEYKSAGTATISVNYNGGATLATVSVTVYADTITSVSWSATNIDVFSGATLTTSGWNVQYHMKSGDSGAANPYTIKLVGQTTDTITAGYTFTAADDGKTMHVEYQGVSSTSVTVNVTQSINNVYADTFSPVTKTWTAASGEFGTTISSVHGTASGEVTFDDETTMSYLRTLEYVVSGKSDYIAFVDDYIMFGSSNSLETLQLTASNTATVTSVVVDCWAKDGATSVSVTVGGNAFDSSKSAPSAKDNTLTFTGSASGNVVITMEKPTKTTGNAQYIKSVSITTQQKSGTVQIANNDSHKAAQKAVVKFAKAFNTAMNGANVCSGTFENLASGWSNASAAYTQFLTDISSLSPAEQDWAIDLLANATAQWGSNADEACVEKAMKTYEWCVSHYSGTCNPFMSAVRPVGRNNYVSPLGVSARNINAAAIVIIVSVISVAAVGGYFFLRKKKEQ